MKLIKNVGLMLVVVAALTACRDKEAEKKIAALESRLSELEGKKSVAPVTPVKEEAKPEGPLAVISFDNLEYDFGTIKEGDIVEHTFKVKNTGDAPLIIQSAQPSCGCTVPDFTKDPIPAGGEGFVKAKFDTKGKTNAQNKTITVTANTWPKQTTLRFKAMVLPKAGEAPPAK